MTKGEVRQGNAGCRLSSFVVNVCLFTKPGVCRGEGGAAAAALEEIIFF